MIKIYVKKWKQSKITEKIQIFYANLQNKQILFKFFLFFFLTNYVGTKEKHNKVTLESPAM